VIPGTPLTDEEKIGMGVSALYVMGIWPVDRIHRTTVTALASVNRSDAINANHRLQIAMRKAERAGLIHRDGMWVDILNHRALYLRAISRVTNPNHAKFVALEDALPAVKQAVTMARGDAEELEARERELDIIRSLMQPYQGGVPRGPRAPRVIGAGRLR
jgi:hypothetical protein